MDLLVSVIHGYIISHSKTSQLKTSNTHYLTLFVGQESGSSLVKNFQL
jgi:hypothetical protein